MSREQYILVHYIDEINSNQSKLLDYSPKHGYPSETIIFLFNSLPARNYYIKFGQTLVNCNYYYPNALSCYVPQTNETGSIDLTIYMHREDGILML